MIITFLDILLNVFLAIAVDNLADADSLTTVEKDETEEEGVEKKSHSPTPIEAGDDMLNDEDLNSERSIGDESETKMQLPDEQDMERGDSQGKIFANNGNNKRALKNLLIVEQFKCKKFNLKITTNPHPQITTPTHQR